MGNLSEIRERLAKAACRSGRDPGAIRLIAAGKGQSPEKLIALRGEGQEAFGENYVQEWSRKAGFQGLEGAEWHFIGHLQKNKVAKVAGRIAWFHALDSLSLAETLQKKLSAPLKCLLEINFGGEASKTGLSPSEAGNILPALLRLDKVDLRGLMTIPPLTGMPEGARPYFQKLFELLKTFQVRYSLKSSFRELSMGMSRDFEIAVEEGSTMVRIGEALFGKRKT